MKVSRISTSIALIVITALAGCQPQGSAEDGADMAKPAATETSLQTIDTVYQSPGKPILVPVEVKYRLLNTPQVGQPLGLELTLVSSVATTGLSYSLQPESGLAIDQAALTKSFSARPAMSPQTTTLSITPQREGRFYLRVVANVVVNGQSKSRTFTIPIQVGAGTRELETLGDVKIDADGERIISLPAKERGD